MQSATLSILFLAAGWIAANMGAWLRLVHLSCRLCVYRNTLLIKTKASRSKKTQKSQDDSGI